MSGIGAYVHLVEVSAKAGPPVEDPEGGYTETWIPLDPPMWYCAIEAASTRDLERIRGGGMTTTATHIIRGRYHGQLRADCRIVFQGRTFDVASVQDVAERKTEMAVIACEVIPPRATGARGASRGGLDVGAPAD